MRLTDRRGDLKRLLDGFAPHEGGLPRDPILTSDESWWFQAGLHAGLYGFETCPDGCDRLRRSGHRGPDHFRTFEGGARHLFSDLAAPEPRLNREYLPHLAAVTRAIVEFGYPREHASFSRYRTFSRDLLHKRAGGSYETDAEFHVAADNLRLQVEAKSDEQQTARLTKQVRSFRLTEMEPTSAKEIEYVLDLRPEILWIVGPGSVHPARFVFLVEVDGLDATFTQTDENLLYCAFPQLWRASS